MEKKFLIFHVPNILKQLLQNENEHRNDYDKVNFGENFTQGD